MFKIKIYCNDNGKYYWEDGVETYETYDKALISCFRNALQESKDLSSEYGYFEAEADFEVTESYQNEELEIGTVFDTATVYYDHAPYDRENDCDIQIVTGYKVVEVN